MIRTQCRDFHHLHRILTTSKITVSPEHLVLWSKNSGLTRMVYVEHHLPAIPIIKYTSILVRKNSYLSKITGIIPGLHLKFLLKISFKLLESRIGRTSSTSDFSLVCPKGTELDVATMYGKGIFER